MTTEQKIAVDDALRTISAELVPNISVMEKSIYSTWKSDVDDLGVNWGNDYESIFDSLRGVVDEHLLAEHEFNVNKKVWDIEENAFVRGFRYAFQCIADGKISLKGGVISE